MSTAEITQWHVEEPITAEVQPVRITSDNDTLAKISSVLIAIRGADYRGIAQRKIVYIPVAVISAGGAVAAYVLLTNTQQKLTSVGMLLAVCIAWKSRYFALAVAKTPRHAHLGVGQLISNLWAWMRDHKGERLISYRLLLLQDEEVDPAQRAEQIDKIPEKDSDHVRTQRIRTYATIAASPFVIMLCALIVLIFWHLMPHIKFITVTVFMLASALVGLGAYGKPADESFIAPALKTGSSKAVTTITPKIINNALVALKITDLKDASQLEDAWVEDPFTEKASGGTVFRLDMPGAITAADVIKKRTALASVLGRPESIIIPECDREISPARLELWIGDASKVRKSPAPQFGEGNFFKSFVIGTDHRGREIDFCAYENNFLVGGIMGSGKTNLMKNVLLHLARDPRTRFFGFDLKGMGDFSAFWPLCTEHVEGEDEEAIADAYQMVMEVHAIKTERTKAIRQISGTPKLTDAIANDVDLYPLVLFTDEIQKLTRHPVYGKKAEPYLCDLLEQGRAPGIFVLSGTQKPTADTFPTSIRDNYASKWCGYVSRRVVQETILGGDAWTEGIHCTALSRTHDKGAGWLIGADESDAAVLLRTPEITDDIMTEEIAQCMALRGGVVPKGAPVTVQDPSIHLLKDIYQLAGSEPWGDKGIWSKDFDALADRLDISLAELKQGLIDAGINYTGKDVSLPCADAACNTKKAREAQPGESHNDSRKGITFADVHEAILINQGGNK